MECEGILSMRFSFVLIAGCALFLCAAGALESKAYIALSSVEEGQQSQDSVSGAVVKPVKEPLFTPIQPHAGAYLSARFAQARHDWEQANVFLDQLVAAGVSDPNVLRRAMIISMGGGKPERAIQLAERIVKLDPNSRNSVAQVFLIIDAVSKKKYQLAAELILNTPHDEMTAFIAPVIDSWVKAGMSKLDVARLQNNPLQLYHGILIADYLKNTEEMAKLLKRYAESEGVSTGDFERVGDLYARLGDKGKALEYYEAVAKEWPNDGDIHEKIKSVKAGKGQDIFKSLESPKEGLALAFFDISKVLYQEGNDESARVMASMALYLDPNLTEVRFLLGYIATRHDRHEEAISHFLDVDKDNKYFADAQRNIADSYESLGRFDDALKILAKLAGENGDLEAQIKIGDIYRRQEKFAQSIEAYTRAEDILGGTVPEKYWHLLYLRGMSYEREGNWDAAEKDLSQALKYKPDQPYILNYLGYAWADRGMNLGEALGMIRKASTLRPDDGYITDSLGWVLYRLGKFKEAVPALERAVSLLPYDPVINDHLGDAYWRVDRKMEARFQWRRAKNHSEDAKLIAEIEEKLVSGLADDSGLALLGTDTQKANGSSAQSVSPK